MVADRTPLRDHECPDTLCPRCDGEGRVGWNPTSSGDPQFDEDAACPCCREECVVTLGAAEAYLDRSLGLEDEFGGWADGWTARDFDPPRVPSTTALCASDGGAPVRATSVRRAPQRRILDRTQGGSTRVLAPGTCPDCERAVSLNKSGKRRYHRDPSTGGDCLGSGVQVEEHAVELASLPPVVVGHEQSRNSDRYALSGRVTCADCAQHVPLNKDGRVRRHRIQSDNPFVPYCTGGAA